MNPPTGGPSNGPSSAGMVNQAIAPTSSCLGTSRRITSRATGSIKAPPTPCSARAATSSGSVLDRLHRTDARQNRPIASVNTRLAPNRSATQPLAGANTARLTR